MLADIRPNEEHANNFVVRTPMCTSVQVGQQMSEHEVNTNPVILVNRGILHTEGGWPKEIDCTEVEQVIRYRKRQEKDEHYIRAVVALCASAEEVIKENNAIDIYEQYWEGETEGYATEAAAAHTLTQLLDPSRSRRGAQYICWHPDGSRRVAVAYSKLEFQRQAESGPSDSYVWDLGNPAQPEATLSATSALVCLNFNLKDSKVLGGGQYNGQFVVFDMRHGSAAVDATPIEKSHRDPVYDFAWLQSKTGTEAMTVSSDGRVLWWDTRRLGEPREELALAERGVASGALSGAVSLDYSPAAGPTKFLVGTEPGSVLLCNRKAKTPADRVGASYSGHHGPVYGVARSPFYPKMFASCGDWTARVWNEDLRTPLITTAYHTAHITSVRWSPTRPSLFFSARADGMLDAWDYYLNSQTAPALSMQVADCALTSLRVHEGGGLVAVGCADGTTSVLQMSSSLVDVQPGEKAATLAMLERETAREKNLEKAQKEAKVRARKTTIAVVAPRDDDPHEVPTAAAETEVEATADSYDDIAQVPDISLPFLEKDFFESTM
ncbi:Dynein intermediate chain 2, axonemal [Coccomyxa sp. Obi]|nr:Dynein intermediate chain 2, axonemal [Coccomyxa sp. Obi]